MSMRKFTPLPSSVQEAAREAVDRGYYITRDGGVVMLDGTEYPPGSKPPPDIQTEVRKKLAAPDDWNVLTAAGLATPLPPVPWVCGPLGLAPGAVSLFAGYGYSRKTMALQSLGLSVATGRPVWGLWSCRHGSFVHLDYEQGRRLTQERYQRLARGMGTEIGELESSSMRACIMPRQYLDADNIQDRLVKLLDGATFVLVDSLRAAFPHADENSSEIRAHLDVLSRVSERTGAAIAVIHHARKPSQQGAGTATHAIRGSSALFDACQSVYVFEGEKDTPTRVHHQKDRVRGLTLDEFGLTSEDVTGPNGESRWGLLVRHLDGAQMAGAQSSREEGRISQVLAKALVQIERLFADGTAGLLVMTRGEIRSASHMNGAAFDLAWAELRKRGRLQPVGKHPKLSWRLGNDPPT